MEYICKCGKTVKVNGNLKDFHYTTQEMINNENCSDCGPSHYNY